MKRRRWRGRFIQWLLYGLFLVLLMEATLQGYYRLTAGDWLFKRIALDIYTPDTYRPWGVKPELTYRHRTCEFDVLYVTNAQGFRVRETDRLFACPKPPSTFRVLLMGPSFAFGWANDYDDSVAGRLEQILQQTPAMGGRTIEVLNAGVPALHILLQKTWLENVGCKYEPDVVVLLNYGTMTSHTQTRKAPYVVSRQGYLVTPGANWCVRLRTRVKKCALVFHAHVIVERLAHGSIGHAAPSELVFDPADGRVVEMRNRLAEFKQHAAQAGARLLVAHAPFSYTIHPEDWPRFRQVGRAEADQANRFDADACRHYADALDVPCLDLTPALQARASDQDERLYFRLDYHWTPAGNRVAAQAIADTLMQGN